MISPVVGAALERLSSSRVLVVGDVMLDRYWWGAVTRISPEAPVPVVKLGHTTLAAGGAANVALNVAGLAGKVTLCGAVGDDEGADLLLGLLHSSGVGTQLLLRAAEHPTTVKTRVLAGGQQITRIDQEVIHELTPEHEDRIVGPMLDGLNDHDAVIISDYAKGLLSERLLRRLIGAAREAGKFVLVDPKGRQYTKYKGASLITPNRHEAAEACGLDELAPGMVEAAGRRLLAGHEFEAVLITQGADGMTLFRTRSEPAHFAASARTVYDVTGAGDTVIATLGSCLAAGISMETAAELANLAAGIVVEQAGTSVVTVDQMRQLRDASEASKV